MSLWRIPCTRAGMGNERGFSLIEIMISMLLVTTGLLTIAHSMGKGIEANYRTREEAQVMAYAQQQIERLQALPLTHADLTAGTHADVPSPGYARSWTVSVSGIERSILLSVTRAIPSQNPPVRVVLSLSRAQ